MKRAFGAAVTPSKSEQCASASNEPYSNSNTTPAGNGQVLSEISEARKRKSEAVDDAAEIAEGNTKLRQNEPGMEENNGQATGPGLLTRRTMFIKRRVGIKTAAYDAGLNANHFLEDVKKKMLDISVKPKTTLQRV